MRRQLYIATNNSELDSKDIALINEIITLNHGCVLAKEDTALINIIEDKSICEYMQVFKRASHQMSTLYADVKEMLPFKGDVTKAIDKAYRYANNEKSNIFKYFNKAVGSFFTTLVYLYNDESDYNRYKSEFSDGKAIYCYNLKTKEATFTLGGYQAPADTFMLYLKG